MDASRRWSAPGQERSTKRRGVVRGPRSPERPEASPRQSHRAAPHAQRTARLISPESDLGNVASVDRCRGNCRAPARSAQLRGPYQDERRVRVRGCRDHANLVAPDGAAGADDGSVSVSSPSPPSTATESIGSADERSLTRSRVREPSSVACARRRGTRRKPILRRGASIVPGASSLR